MSCNAGTQAAPTERRGRRMVAVKPRQLADHALRSVGIAAWRRDAQTQHLGLEAQRVAHGGAEVLIVVEMLRWVRAGEVLPHLPSQARQAPRQHGRQRWRGVEK